VRAYGPKVEVAASSRRQPEKQTTGSAGRRREACERAAEAPPESSG
jgi:hypothetical protein